MGGEGQRPRAERAPVPVPPFLVSMANNCPPKSGSLPRQAMRLTLHRERERCNPFLSPGAKIQAVYRQHQHTVEIRIPLIAKRMINPADMSEFRKKRPG